MRRVVVFRNYPPSTPHLLSYLLSLYLYLVTACAGFNDQWRIGDLETLIYHLIILLFIIFYFLIRNFYLQSDKYAFILMWALWLQSPHNVYCS